MLGGTAKSVLLPAFIANNGGVKGKNRFVGDVLGCLVESMG
jgi:hypothetical protein